MLECSKRVRLPRLEDDKGKGLDLLVFDYGEWTKKSSIREIGSRSAGCALWQ